MDDMLSLRGSDPRVGDGGRSLGLADNEGTARRNCGSSSVDCDCFNLLGDTDGVFPLLPECGVVGWIDVGGGEAVDWRRNGEVRGEPKERGDGLYGVVLGVT